MAQRFWRNDYLPDHTTRSDQHNAMCRAILRQLRYAVCDKRYLDQSVIRCDAHALQKCTSAESFFLAEGIRSCEACRVQDTEVPPYFGFADPVDVDTALFAEPLRLYTAKDMNAHPNPPSYDDAVVKQGANSQLETPTRRKESFWQDRCWPAIRALAPCFSRPSLDLKRSNDRMQHHWMD